MSLHNIIIAAAVVAVVGLVIAILLSVAEKAFHVDVDEKEVAVRECLGGNNCGACGYAGCDALAKAIASGEESVNSCPPAGQSGADKIAEIMGVEAGEFVHQVAYVSCSGTCDKRKQSYNYFGTETCSSVKAALGRGKMSCRYGCLGYGDCANACDNRAIRIVDNKAVVEEELCIACGKCVKACPQNLIELVPYESKYRVQCRSYDKGKAVKVNCDAGCIGCGICQRNCPNDAIKVQNNYAKIDYEKCVGCGICAEKCPSKVIVKF
ncbi:MAG: RnfABCDGE type electron transport complex subunit B [Eubacterium sp.]